MGQNFSFRLYWGSLPLRPAWRQPFLSHHPTQPQQQLCVHLSPPFCVLHRNFWGCLSSKMLRRSVFCCRACNRSFNPPVGPGGWEKMIICVFPLAVAKKMREAPKYWNSYMYWEMFQGLVTWADAIHIFYELSKCHTRALFMYVLPTCMFALSTSSFMSSVLFYINYWLNVS